MRLRRFVWLLLSLSLSLVTVFSAESIDAAAALTGGRYMTPAESLQVFGSEIPFSYYNGSEYVQASFQYDSTDSIIRSFGGMPANWSDYSGMTYLRYVASTSGLSTDISYITVDIRPSYSIFDTDQIYSLIALSSASNYSRVSTIYQSPSWDWVIAGQSEHYENSLTQSGGYYSGVQFSGATCTFVPMAFSSQSLTSGYSTRAVFCGNNGSTLYLFIGCPYVSASAEGSNGTFTETSSGGINVDVTIDMSETNSLLEGISSAISGIWSGITGVFVPSDDFFDDWKSDISEALDDSFGRYSEVDDLLEDVKDSIVGAAPSSDISLPAVSIPHGISLSAQTWHVVPSGWSDIIDYIKFGFDILFTCLFVNTVRQRLRTIIHGETLVEVEGVD